jgi:hypothetical protein
MRGYALGLSRREEEREFYNSGLLVSLVLYSVFTEICVH